MTTSTSRPIKLIDIAERLLLEATDEELLMEAGQTSAVATNQVFNVVKASYASAAKFTQRNIKNKIRKPNRPAQNGVLLSYLKKLAKVNPQLLPGLSTAFSAKQTPNQDEIEHYAVELLKKNLQK